MSSTSKSRSSQSPSSTAPQNSVSPSSSSTSVAGNNSQPTSSSSSPLSIAGSPSSLANSPSSTASSASLGSVSSSQTAKAAAARAKSPLNPSYTSIHSASRSEVDHGHVLPSGSSTPAFSTATSTSPTLGSPFSPSPSSKKARGRGNSVSVIPEHRTDTSPALDRVLSGPTAVPASSSATTIMLSPSLTVRGEEFQDEGASSFRARTRSRSRSPHPGPIDESVWHKAIGIMSPPVASASHSTWWSRDDDKSIRPWKDPQRKESIPPEQTEGWDNTRKRVAQAASSVLGTAVLVTHEVLLISADLLELAPVPGLQAAARTLLLIWESLQEVDMNRLQCLRLTERCAEILLSVRQEIYEAGDLVGEELKLPISKLVECFANVYVFLQKQAHRPFLKRYLKRDEIIRQIAACDAGLQDALGMFSLSIQIRILKQVQLAEVQQHYATQEILKEIVTSRERSESLTSIALANYSLSQASSGIPGNAYSLSQAPSGPSGNALQLTGIEGAASSRPPWPYSQAQLLPSSVSSSEELASATPRHSLPHVQPQLLSPAGMQSFNYMQQGSSQSLLSSLTGLPESSSHPSLTSGSSRSGSVTPASTQTQRPTLVASPPPPSVSVTPSSQPSTSSRGSSSAQTPTGGTLPYPTKAATTPDAPDSQNLPPLFVPPSRLSPSRVLPTIQSLTQRQNMSDAESDYADLRNYMRGALGKGSDAEMMAVLGVKREDMPEAIKTLQRALEALVEMERRRESEVIAETAAASEDAGVVAVDGVAVAPSKRPGPLPRKNSKGSTGKGALARMARRISVQAGVGGGPFGSFATTPIAEDEQVGYPSGKLGKKEKGRLKRSKTVSTTTTESSVSSAMTEDSIQSQAGSSSKSGSKTGSGGSGESRPAVLTKDTLDREFIESGIDALRRMSRGAQKALSLPSWTITRYEIDRNEKIGIGFFSDVYKGTWRPSTSAPSRTVAIKVLAETTPRKLFVREVTIWKALSHPNVLELYGASSASGDPPWFFVSPYLKNGSLSEFLRRLAQGEGGPRPPAGLMLGGMYDGGARSRTASFPGWSGGGLGSLVGAHSPGGRDNTGLGLGLTSGASSGSISPKSSIANLGTGGPGAKKGSRGRSGSGSTIVATGGGEIAKEWDLLRFMHEIAKGMEYLHSNGVLHGDLKAANVLVDDRIHCVITDFGQSEMKSEAYRISGTPPPHGTLRWQAPELMSGLSQLTVEMDVYAYAISCIEILSLGRMPWPLSDDDSVRHYVLKDGTRPSIPATRFTTPELAEIVRACWATDPFERPSFSKVAHDLKAIRKNAGFNPEDVASPRLPDWKEWDFQHKHVSKPSPDMHPIPLPPGSPPREDRLGPPMLSTSPSSSSDATSFRTARERDLSVSPPISGFAFRKDDAIATTRLQMPDTVVYTPSGPPSSRASSLFTSTPSTSQSEEEALNNPVDYDGYDSPPPANDRIAEARNERRYRLLLVHEFHPSLTLPLWSPVPVALGAVGYLSKPNGEFVTLFNAFNPEKSINVLAKGLPSVYGYGKVSTGSQRQDKRNVAQRGFDSFAGLWKFKTPQNSARRYSFPLRAGHKTAYVCTETTIYRYVENLDAPKKWFKSNVDNILDVFGAHHHIQKEDLFFVIGTLDTPEYALFVSHNHPDGQAHFNIFTSAKVGQPWGKFTTDTETPSELGGPSYHEPIAGGSLYATKVSTEGSPWNTVLLARLRFKPDVAEPTSL